jgi:hypothetical protein
MAHGTAEEMGRAKTILAANSPSRLDMHAGAKAAESADRLVYAVAE